MKNILIMGIGRAGKTTLSEMIKDKYNNYTLISAPHFSHFFITNSSLILFYLHSSIKNYIILHIKNQ